MRLLDEYLPHPTLLQMFIAARCTPLVDPSRPPRRVRPFPSRASFCISRTVHPEPPIIMSYRDDASSTLYDPPIPKRGRSASFSASTAAPSVFRSSSLPRRQSFSGAQDDIPYNGGARFTDGEKQLQTPLTKLYDSLDRSTFSDEEADRMANGGRGDTREGVVFDGNGSEVGVGPAGQMSQDERADRRKRRMGRQSKGQEEGGDQHVSRGRGTASDGGAC